MISISKNIRKFKQLSLTLSLMTLFPLANDVASEEWKMADKIVASIQLPNIPNSSFAIEDFGANPLEGFDSRPAIMAAIDKASESGGGKVVVAKGTWFVKGPIHLKSNINLHLEDGARLLFSADAADYLPAVKTRWEGTEVISYSPLIYAANVTDVAITGKGTIDGNDQSEFIGWIKKAKPDYLKLRHMGATGTPLTERVFAEGTYLRPPLIQFITAQRVLLEDYTSNNSPFWVNHVVYSNDVTIRRLRIESHIGNNDGIDIESTSNVLIEDSWFRTGDDSVVIKSGRDLDGRTVGIPSTNIVVRNNDMGGEDGIGLGSEMSGGIKNVFFTDNVLREGDSAFRFKANLDRGGLVENIYLRNFHVERFKNLFWFQLNYPRQGTDKFPSTYRNIVFDNITAEQAQNVFEIHAPKEQPLMNVTFKNIKVNSYKNLFNVENANNIVLDNFVAGKQRIDATLQWSQINNRSSNPGS